MAKAATKDGNEATAQPAAASGRDDAAPPAFNSMMANPVAAFAAATAMGFSFSNHMANAFFGAFQSAVDSGQKFSALLEKQSGQRVENPPAQPVAVDTIVAERPVVPEPVDVPTEARPDRAVTVKPAVRKTVTPKRVERPAAQPNADVTTTAVPVAKVARGKADDLKRISGVGPKLEQVLNGLGIRRFADIAAWSGDEMRRIDAELGVDGRVERDDWIGQAKTLAGAKAGKK